MSVGARSFDSVVREFVMNPTATELNLRGVDLSQAPIEGEVSSLHALYDHLIFDREVPIESLDLSETNLGQCQYGY